MKNLLAMLFKPKRKTSFFNMFGRKRNNRKMMWGSALSLAMSAAAYGLNRRRTGSNSGQGFQNMMSNTSLKGIQPNFAAINEFANEIAPDKKTQQNK
ncbi:hypothetical protein [Bacillus sp. AK031]